jgi:altronate hydrolase
MTAPDFIVLNNADNVATALHNVPSGTPAHVSGPTGELPSIQPATEINLGHKIAISGIRSGELVVKHGHPFGRATAEIAPGEHVHTHNVISLSRETDRVQDDEGA